IFDANGDGVNDVWLAMRDRNYLTLGTHPEREPNDAPGAANLTRSLPALRTGVINLGDQDVFSLPAAVAAGARVRLQPSASGDLRLRILDAAGAVLFTAQSGGPGVAETIDLPAGSAAAHARVEAQGAPGGVYRLEILRAGTPLAVVQGEAVALPPRAPAPASR
ncbi:MAG TPA: hypothetical protein VFO85_13640, partial [Vicinamibacteria bacterium]|nr:hypothetical protein [Vicinamibacteria bacterium]